ncbi:MAG: helix-turn-helix transcriptional regulator [Kofleriaceae bacterium]
MTLFSTLDTIRIADSFLAVADGLVAGLVAHPGIRGVAVVGYDTAGNPSTWIGEGFEPSAIRQYLDGGHRDDPTLAHVRETGMPVLLDDAVYALAWGHRVLTASLWVLPIHGLDPGQPFGCIRVLVDDGADPKWSELGLVAVHVAVRLALLGIEAATPFTLTPRQREIAWLVARGCTNAEIAGMLGVSAHAVKKHVSRVLALLDVTNRTELAAISGRWSAPELAVTRHRVITRGSAA